MTDPTPVSLRRMRAAAHPDAALLTDRAARCDSALSDALGPEREVAMVNFPNHRNSGDSALWLGAKASLKRLGVRVRYSCAWNTFDLARLNRLHPVGPVLLNGGGNFGDLYAGQQGLREHLLTTVRARRTWTRDSTVAHWAHDGHEASRIAERLLTA